MLNAKSLLWMVLCGNFDVLTSMFLSIIGLIYLYIVLVDNTEMCWVGSVIHWLAVKSGRIEWIVSLLSSYLSEIDRKPSDFGARLRKCQLVVFPYWTSYNSFYLPGSWSFSHFFSHVCNSEQNAGASQYRHLCQYQCPTVLWCNLLKANVFMVSFIIPCKFLWNWFKARFRWKCLELQRPVALSWVRCCFSVGLLMLLWTLRVWMGRAIVMLLYADCDELVVDMNNILSYNYRSFGTATNAL